MKEENKKRTELEELIFQTQIEKVRLRQQLDKLDVLFSIGDDEEELNTEDGNI